LTGITAAVVGVTAYLAVYFALHTLFDVTSRMTAGPFGFEYPHPSTLQRTAFAITVLG
jgi:chromate transporter